MFKNDLTVDKCNNYFKKLKLINIGWLDKDHKYVVGNTSKIFLDCLFILCLYPINPTMGYHNCPFCTNELKNSFLVSTSAEKRKGMEVILGTAEIRVIGLNGKIYNAPNLIYHYVKYHNYKPPKEFIDSVIYNSFIYIPLILFWYWVIVKPMQIFKTKKYRESGVYKGDKLIRSLSDIEKKKEHNS